MNTQNSDLVKVCKSSDEAKVQRKIFLVPEKLSLIERLHERILELRNKITDLVNFDIDNKEADLGDSLEEIDKLNARIEELQSFLKIIKNEKCVLLDDALEEKIIRTVTREIGQSYDTEDLEYDWNNGDRQLTLDVARKTIQKLKEQAFSLPEKDLDEKEGE